MVELLSMRFWDLDLCSDVTQHPRCLGQRDDQAGHPGAVESNNVCGHSVILHYNAFHVNLNSGAAGAR